MLIALRSETRKLFATPATLWIVIASIVSTALISAALVAHVINVPLYAPEDRTRTVMTFGATLSVPPVPAWIVALVALAIWGEEFRGKGLALTLTGQRRLATCLAKTIVATVGGAVLTTSLSASAALTLYASSSTSLDWNVLLNTLVRVLAFSALLNLAAVSVAMLIRSRGGAVAIFFIAAWLVEPAVIFSLNAVEALSSLLPYEKNLPFTALSSILTTGQIGDFFTTARLGFSAALSESLLIWASLNSAACVVILRRDALTGE